MGKGKMGIFEAKSPIKGRRLGVLGIIEKTPARSENVDWLTGLLTQDPLGPQLHHVMIHGYHTSCGLPDPSCCSRLSGMTILSES